MAKAEKSTDNKPAKEPVVVIPPVPIPDYYVSAQYRGPDAKGNYKQRTNYTLSVFEDATTKVIKIQELKKDQFSELTYTSYKEFSFEWTFIVQLINYRP